jgi:regulator of cell morphogenesis and NO signaling
MIKSYENGITVDSCPADIVKQYYQTASVFRGHGIEYCCGGKWPLKMVCETKGIDPGQLMEELQRASRTISVPGSLPFDQWKTDFLADYIINIHHEYLRRSLPEISGQLKKFVSEHAKKHPQLPELERLFNLLQTSMLPHLLQEEEVIFPYIRQIAHAYESRETYASLLVRTLRKPVEDIMHHEHKLLEKTLYQFRELTNNYTPPEASCTSHRLSFSLLKELDDDLVQHVYLENEILFPRAIAMEKELLRPH